MNQNDCVQYCIDNVFMVPFDCWSVEWISNAPYDANSPSEYRTSNTGGVIACRPQSKTLFGSSSGYGLSRNTYLYERSCKYVNEIGLNVNAAYDIVDSVNIEYELQKNSGTKPFFVFGLSPYPETCMLNCRTNLVFYVDGGTPCSITWDPNVSTTTSEGRWSKKTCSVTGKGLGLDKEIQISNEGIVTVMSNAPYTEDTFHYKIEVTVVGYSSFNIEGDFKLLCASRVTAVTTPAAFSTDIIGFLKDSGTHSFKFEELVSNECPIVKYEIDSYSSNKVFSSQDNQVSIDITQEGCLTAIQTGDLAHYSQVGNLCKTIKFKADIHLEKHIFRIKSTSQGILHAKGTKIQYSDWIEIEIVCGSITSGGVSVPTLSQNFMSNQQYLPGSTNVGWISPQHISQKTECQMDTYQMISQDDVSDRNTCTLEPVKYKARRNSLASSVVELTNFQCTDQQTSSRIFQRTGVYTQQKCKSECQTAGGTAQRMKGGQICECYHQECTTVMMNNIKGSEKANWITYRWECISQNIMTSVFSNANNAIDTVTDNLKKIIMIHPSEMLGSNQALVIENVQGTFQSLLTNKNDLRTVTFYVLSIADGGKQLVSGPYSTKIACDQTLTVQEITTIVPVKQFVLNEPNYHRVTINPYDVMHPDEPSRSIKQYCPILTYTPTASAGVVALKPQCAQPCLIFDFVNTKPIDHSTTVSVTVSGGVSFTSTTPITAKIGCGPLSTEITLPTISTPYAYSLIPNDLDLPRVELDYATSQTIECPIESWTLTNDGSANTNLLNIQNQVYSSNGKTIIKVSDTTATKTTFGTYQFYLTSIARGGYTKTTPQITLNTRCFINVPTITSHIYEIIHNDPDFPRVEFTDTPAINACTISSIVITADGKSDTNLNGLSSQIVRVGGKIIIKVLPENVKEVKTYKFYLTYTAQDGQVKTTSQISLDTVCGPLSGDITLPIINSPYTYQILEFDTDVPFVKLDRATNSLTVCPIEGWTLTSDGVSNTILDRIQPTVVVDSITGETTIKVTADQRHVLSQFRFYLTYTARGGQKKTTSQITLNTECGPLSTTITIPKLSTPYKYDLVYNDPGLPQVVLSDPINSIAACPVEQKVLTSDGKLNTVLDRVQNTVTRQNGFDNVRINADQAANVGTYSFYLTYIAKGGSQTTTPQIILNTKCAKGSTNIEVPTIQSPQFIELGTPDSGFSFDQFINNHKFCKDLDYKITDKGRQQHPGFEKTVKFESKLMFKLIKVNEKQNFDDIYIINTARGGDEKISGPYSLIVNCKNQSACGVPKKLVQKVEIDQTSKDNQIQNITDTANSTNLTASNSTDSNSTDSNQTDSNLAGQNSNSTNQTSDQIIIEQNSTSSSFKFIQPKKEIMKQKQTVNDKQKDPKIRPGWTPPNDSRQRKQANLPVILGLNKISRSGLVSIEFNQKLQIPDKFKKVRKLSGDGIFEISLGNKDGERHNFENQIVNWTEDGIDIQLNFENPIEISSNSLSLAKISVKKPELFVSEESGEALKKIGDEDLHFIKLVPRQIPNDVDEESLNSQAHTASLILLVIVIIMLNTAFWLNAEMHHFWTFLSMLQIVVYMPIIKVNLPPNTEIYLEAQRHIAEFELWDTQTFITGFGSLFGITEYISTSPEAEEYQNAGFKSLNFWDNMKYNFFLLACFIFVIIIIFICSFFKYCEPRSSKMIKKIQKKWTWSNTLRTISVLFLQTIISFAIASKVTGKPFIITVGTIIAAYPLWTLLFLSYYRNSLINRVVIEKYWALYGNLKFKEQSALFYPFISCSRKAIFVWGAVILTKWSYFQIQLFTLLNIFYSIYFAYYHPNARIMDFRLELFNEWAIQIMCFHLMCFTDMVQITTEPKINYLIGESFKLFFTVVILFNLFVFGYSLVRPVRNYLRRRQFRKALPTLIEKRMLERQIITKKANDALSEKINSIFVSSDQTFANKVSSSSENKSVVNDQAIQKEIKKQFFLKMQARKRELEINRMRNLNEDYDTITKKVFKDRKKEKMKVDNENLYSSSSDEDDITKAVAPTLLHVFNHKFFQNLKQSPMVIVKENIFEDNLTQRQSHDQQ